jgi:hypothetical protein
MTRTGLWVSTVSVLLFALAGARPPQWSQAKIADFQGDLMIWAPEVGCAPEARIRCEAQGLKAGWVWTVSLPRYSAAHRAQLYDRLQSHRYTHVAIRVTACEAGGGYHDLYPNTTESCVKEVADTNAVLRELAERRLIPVCAGVGPQDPADPGIDLSKCPVALNDWDNSARAWERLKVLQQTFPPTTLLYFELPLGAEFPEASGGDEPVVPRADNGSDWLREVRRRIPNFMGVLHELDEPGTPANDRHLRTAHAWWSDVQEVNFESDTYWKFWGHLTEEGQRQYNDDLMRTYPWLRGCMSGCTAH